jgi:putative ABC transport system substrate-binding protein
VAQRLARLFLAELASFGDRAAFSEEFITLLGGTAAWPLAARAQQALPRVGFLVPGTPASEGAYVSTLLRGLNETNLVNDRDFVPDLRYAEGRLERMPALVSELVDKKVSGS